MTRDVTPKARGYGFPAEWLPHRATWLSWPHNKNSWPGKITTIYKPYCEFIKMIARGEEVCINVTGIKMEKAARLMLNEIDANLDQIKFYHHPTNDAWCRDHGPAFVIDGNNQKAIINWEYNAWGEKYPPYDLDNQIPSKIASVLSLPMYSPGVVMEGGSVDFNNNGIVLTTEACLLNKNRNANLSKADIEQYIKGYYGANEVWWLNDGIVGDDTDGHIDDITRFVSNSTIVTAIENNEADANYTRLQKNLKVLNQLRFPNGTSPNIVKLPMPKPVIFKGQRLPASYANFYIANSCVVVPTYRDPAGDHMALEILSSLFSDREVIGIDSTDMIWGLGSFHCLSQQEPI